MNWNAIEFCPKLPPKSAGGNTTCGDYVAKLLADNLFNGSTQAQRLLAARYQQMKDNYPNVPHDDSRWDLELGSMKVRRYKTDKAALLPVPHGRMGNCGALVNQLWNHPNFGLDMPTWMVKRDVKKPHRVMIVAQDPLRTDQEKGNLVLSTPFGFHSADYRNVCCENHTLCCFVERLLEECEVCVYLTDCRKFYTSDRFVNARKRQFKGLFDNVLHAEMEIFNPDLIVALGNDAADAIGAKRPGRGCDVQRDHDPKVLAAYHTGARPKHFKNFVESGSKSDYFAKVFETVHGELDVKHG